MMDALYISAVGLQAQKAQLDAKERAVLGRVERALREAKHGEFMCRLWTPSVRHTPRGAVGRLPIGLHVGNRVGHVQGGISMYTALATAVAAVPHHPLVTAIAAWYISPGEGKALSARSTVLQKGRNVAVVRTELFGAGRPLGGRDERTIVTELRLEHGR